MIDRVRLLATLRPAVTRLEDDIRRRVAEVPELRAHLTAERALAVAAGRTVMSPEQWQEGEITQASVAWVLGGVFVRFLEDNRLVDQPLIAGPGERRAAALDRREDHFHRHRDHSDREYLEQCFRDAAAFPAVAALFDERHNPLWRLGPTADGARGLRETLAALDADTGELAHDFTDPDLDTRFLGDLYQDLSETAKRRYALLQTPHFVESFILDRTLDPAIAEFGLASVRMIDPACGSGHFLIGSFQRLFARWREREPGTEVAVLAQRALDAVHGVDLNPFATAIARFRLTIAALRRCGVGRLAEAPALSLNLATGDSLLHGGAPARLPGMDRYRAGIAHVFETEDAEDLRRILGRGYHAVVGNPPYIAVADRALRDAYRERYESCHGKYVLTVPFMERFFELARVEAEDGSPLAGFVGKITSNSFMKREFGAPLVERFLPSVDIQTMVDASGAYIPGHGTPTVLLFGRARPALGATLRVVDGIRGEPRQPEDPARGLVWTSILRLVEAPDTRDSFVRSSNVSRAELLVHPMTLGLGRQLRRRLEADRRSVRDYAVSAGFASFTGMDDGFILDRGAIPRYALDHVGREFITGDSVRDWGVEICEVAIAPYDGAFDPLPLAHGGSWIRILWPNREVALSVTSFGGNTRRMLGESWWTWYRWVRDKYRTRRSLTWGEVATHNHFAFDRGGRVFKQTAPVIKLPDASSEDDHVSLLGVLNSSTACFWLKQVCQTKGGGGVNEGYRGDAWEFFFQFNATKVQGLPIPPDPSSALAREVDRLGSERAALLDALADLPADPALAEELAVRRAREAEIEARMISLQEELDWEVLAAFGLVPKDLPVLGPEAPALALGERAFEIVLARQVAAGAAETSWFQRHGSTPITELPAGWPADYRAVVERRIALIEGDPDVGLIERPEHKRRWARRPWAQRQADALTALVLDALEEREQWEDLRLRSTAELTDRLRARPRMVEALELLADRADADLAMTVRRLVSEAAVPHLVALRLTERGIRKRAVWERVWELQRAEDRIDARVELAEEHPQRLDSSEAAALKAREVGPIPVPPRYERADFRTAVSWGLRGKLDVPKERFTLVPGAERGADRSPVVGWAGWDERDLARALAGRITELREHEAADAEWLTPLLAGVLELVPWIHQWHPGAEQIYGGPPGRWFEEWLDGQLGELGVTREALRAWRPPAPARGRRRVVRT